ncbi:MAG: hypothetical protein JSR25_01940 [Proteobacteria bacterium]|mgnify:CR=1 FL=1|nr:hypothetical protein [Pseudomonadota bacterium]
MEPFHAFLSKKCHHCGTPLLRLGLSANNDIVVCPACLKAGAFDDVLEEGGELTDGYDFSADTKAMIKRLWAERAAT